MQELGEHHQLVRRGLLLLRVRRYECHRERARYRESQEQGDLDIRSATTENRLLKYAERGLAISVPGAESTASTFRSRPRRATGATTTRTPAKNGSACARRRGLKGCSSWRQRRSLSKESFRTTVSAREDITILSSATNSPPSQLSARARRTSRGPLRRSRAGTPW